MPQKRRKSRGVLEYELEEALAEIRRHHAHFAKIREVVWQHDPDLLLDTDPIELREVIYRVRSIVG
jgi:hypothetical protein